MAGKIELKAPLDGVLTIEPEDTASNFTVTIPAGNAELFSQANVVGTVSESGGVPTGAIIERGSNANGEYVKYADGTMICVSPDINHPDSSNATWTFPAIFAVAPGVSGLVLGANRVVTNSSGGGVSTTQSNTRVYILQANPARSTADAVLTAIGRWF